MFVAASVVPSYQSVNLETQRHRFVFGVKIESPKERKTVLAAAIKAEAGTHEPDRCLRNEGRDKENMMENMKASFPTADRRYS